jgi:hypothetical protein
LVTRNRHADGVDERNRVRLRCHRSSRLRCTATR